MRGDFSRTTFRARNHYRAVLMQQGRVQVDADWNEQQAIQQHRTESETVDVIGRCGAPRADAGFRITTDGAVLTIGPGRLYVDGILCENEQAVPYAGQPDLPPPPEVREALAESRLGLVYLDAWERHLTALDDPLIREKALGGPDTATRVKTVWQVRVLPLARPAEGARPRCDEQLPEWLRLIAPSTGRLNARTEPAEAVDDCALPPTAGYQRLDNQLYRVEVHQGGALESGAVTFKWSRDNGTVVTAIESISGPEITVQDVGPDEALGLAPGQWVELTDAARELAGLPGQLLEVMDVSAASRVVRLSEAPGGLDPAAGARLRRWDQAGPDARGSGVVARGGWQLLEAGVQVRFSEGSYHSGDYWLVPARAAIGEIEWPPYAVPNTHPVEQRPMGIEHHYCRLALVEIDAEGKLVVTQDCRALFPPLTELSPATAPGRAFHVVGTSWANDDVVHLGDLFNGLRIDLDGVLTPSGGAIAGPALSVFLDLTPPFGGEGRQSPNLLGLTLSYQVRGTIQLQPGRAGSSLRWLPDDQGLVALQTLLESPNLPQPVRARAVLKGHLVWGQQANELLYVDGQAFGRPDRRADGTPRTALVFPTGRGSPASDFESWFLLTR